MAYGGKSALLSGMLLLAGCASADVTPMAQNVVLVSSSAAMACGQAGARQVAFQRAATETIRRGYDKFYIVDARGGSDIRQIGTTPVYGTSTMQGQVLGNTFYGTGQTTVTGGQPIYGGSHSQELAVVMFRSDDPEAANAIDARTELGPDWQTKVAENAVTCL